MAADTSSAAAGVTRVVETVAAALAALSLEPISAMFAAVAASASGVEIMYGMCNPLDDVSRSYHGPITV